MNARYYLRVVGRFVSADTLIPDPANPQDFNRFSYGYNNPLRFNDPTGHCGADISENSGETEDLYYQCVGIRDELEGLYSILISGIWKLEEMVLLKDSFDILNDFLVNEIGIVDSIGAISTMLDGAEYHRARRGCNLIECPFDEARAITSGRGNKVTFFDSAFWNNSIDSKREDISVIETIIHETAHVWDNSNGGEFSDGMMKAAGSTCFFGICSEPPDRIFEATNKKRGLGIFFCALCYWQFCSRSYSKPKGLHQGSIDSYLYPINDVKRE